MQRNIANQSIGAQLVTATTGAAFTGAVTVAVTGDSGTQAVGTVGAGACTHEGNGYHSYRPAQAETNYAHVAFTFTGTGAIPVTVQIFTSFPQTGDAFLRLGAPVGASTSVDIAAIKTVVGALTDAAADGAPTTTDTLVQYLKQLINTLEGPAGMPLYPAAVVPGNAVSLAEVLRQVYNDVANLQGRVPTALTGAGNMKSDLLALNGSAPAAVNLAAAHLAYLTGTVTDATPAAGDFQGDLALSPTDEFYQYALLAFTSGALQGLARQISTYDGDTRQFLFTGTGENADAPFPAAPANGDTFMLIGRIGT